LTILDILTPYSPKRIVLLRAYNPCSTIEAFKHHILYALTISYGIRVDTVVAIGTGRQAVVLTGYGLKHFHPQEKSLSHFLESILCKNKLYPGVSLIPLNILMNAISSNTAVEILARRRGYDEKSIPCHLKLPGLPPKIVLINVSGEKILDNEQSMCLETPVPPDKPYFIIASNYILDLAYGTWVRRRGKIEWKKPIRYNIDSAKTP